MKRIVNLAAIYPPIYLFLCMCVCVCGYCRVGGGSRVFLNLFAYFLLVSKHGLTYVIFISCRFD